MSFVPSTPRSRLISEFAGYPEHMAVVNDDIEALDAALAAADGHCWVEHHHGTRDSPLELAIRLHRTRMIEHLIDVGSDIVVILVSSGREIRTPAVAAEVGDERVMTMLIQAGHSLHEYGNFDQTLCHYAARNADAGVLRVLVEAGAPFDEERGKYGRPIHLAAKNENEQVLAILLATDVSLRGVVQAASSNRNERVLAMLMKAGVDINAMDSDGSFPIHHAAQNPNAAVVRLLIDAGVDVNVVDSTGENPLFNACWNPNMEVLDALLAAGAEWRDVGTKRSICHAVARNTNEAMVRRVIERGVDVNARDSDGKTPLMIAAAHSPATVVSIFLEAGANVHATDKEHQTACFYACMNTDPAIVRMLLAAGTPFSGKVLKAAFSSANVDAVQDFIDAGMNFADEINADPALVFRSTDWHKLTPAMLDFFHRHGLDFRVRLEGRTLCHESCARGCGAWSAVWFARGHAADFNNLKNNYGRTPMQMARGDAVLTLVATGIDSSQRSEFADRDRCFFAAVGHPRVPSVPRRELAWACNQIAERQFYLLRLRAFQVCVGLQNFRLPALVTCEILAHAFAPLESLVAFHRVWAIVTTIKHFQTNLK